MSLQQNGLCSIGCLSMRAPAQASPAATPARAAHTFTGATGEFDPQKYERPSMKQDEIAALKRLFDACDTEGTGQIHLRDLKHRMHNAGYESRGDVIGEMLSHLDRDGRTSLNFKQFLDLLTTDETPYKTPEDISRTFSQFDPEGTGFITHKMLARTARELNMTPNPDISEILERTDADNDGKIGKDEFHNVMDKQTFP
ncbi:EF hand domain-containing protein [Besnoitia besnoiti]|uniref:EF hand domain-containing protein n=1 Tax=Besnoitia besnoiti TaxID=94643 RepID=A0A2A9MCH9_BESBE|nr:EF hand domain-containing protein [Besnoitia besnoiti]PFH33100.1 EF hand domain-containing protein [Besnoitia besnoiti]